MWIRVHKCALPARLRLLVAFHSVPAFHLSPPTAGLFFFTGEISPKREIKNQKQIENENVLKVFKSPEVRVK
jgi:hypothetical protein